MKLITINVDAEFIKEGEKAHCTLCPIALAIKEKLKPGFTSIVYTGSFRILDSNGNAYFPPATKYASNLPEEAVFFIRDFDLFGSAAPLTFEIELPEEVLR